MRKQMSAADITALLNGMLKHPTLEAHAKTLLGPRTRGSTTTIGLMSLLEDREAHLITPPDEVLMSGCSYYTTAAPELGGELGAIPLRDVVSRGLAFKYRVGAHGPELYLDVPRAEAKITACNFITLIVGPDREYAEFPDGILYTWHPGFPLASLSLPLNDHTAVKLHNGS